MSMASSLSFICGTKAAFARILLVGGDRFEREVLRRRLDRLGYDCDGCDTPDVALECAAAKNFELILIDTTALDNGSESFLRKILAINPDAAIIVTTAGDDIGTAVESLKNGVYDWIARPFTPEEITLSISRSLEKRRLLLENRDYQRTLEEQVARRTGQLRQATQTLELTCNSTLIALVRALDSRDKNAAGRSSRVMACARRLGQQIGIDGQPLRELERAALLHDIGKIGIPDALLRKHELTDAEKGIMRTHPEIGCNILSGIKFFSGVAQLVLQSHERYDGQGYPMGLRGDAIALGARILAVADAFEEMVENATGANALDEARWELGQLAGTRLDPHLVEEFLYIHTEEWRQIRIDASVDATDLPHDN